MEPCLLCLEINKGLLDSIQANSKQWQELNVTRLIEKHFWPLNTIQYTSCICVTCWQEIDNFHKFYMRIEEAHMNFGRLIKVEDESQLEYNEDSTIEKSKIKSEKKYNSTYCYIEPEILIDQPQSSEDLTLDENPYVVERSKDHDDISLEKPYKNECSNKDPLRKPKKSKQTKTRSKRVPKTKTCEETDSLELSHEEEETKVIIEAVDSRYNDGTDVNKQPDKNSSKIIEGKIHKTYNKHRPNRKENDKFIAENFKQMFCDICQVPFKDFPDMQKHFTDSHGQRGYLVCCKKKFIDRTRLIDHIHYHMDPDYFKCSECDKVMSNRLHLIGHMMRVHRPSEVEKKHFCDVCGKPFAKACVLRFHKLTHLPEEEKKFPCTECGKSYGSAYMLNQHVQVVHLKKNVKICYICGKSISSSTDYKNHMNKHEGLPAPNISCDICGLRMTTERGLKRHKESQHPVGGKKEHFCPICPKISPTLKALKKHINTMHEKGYDHKCTMCEKAFKRSEALKEHMASHTGIALYTCPWCPKTFNSNGNMHSHRKNTHPKEWEALKLQKYSGNINNVVDK